MGVIVDGNVRPASFDPYSGWVFDTWVGMGQGCGCAARDEHRTRFLSDRFAAGFIQVFLFQPTADHLRGFGCFAFAIELAGCKLFLLPVRGFGFDAADNLVGAERAIAGRGEVRGRSLKNQEKMTEKRLAASECLGDAADRDAGTVDSGDGYGTVKVVELMPVGLKQRDGGTVLYHAGAFLSWEHFVPA
jgi:hypothetical protein